MINRWEHLWFEAVALQTYLRCLSLRGVRTAPGSGGGSLEGRSGGTLAGNESSPHSSIKSSTRSFGACSTIPPRPSSRLTEKRLSRKPL
jgi:hypothetical protein